MIADCTEIGAKVIVFGNHRPASILIMPDGKAHYEKSIEYNDAAMQAAIAGKAAYYDMSKLNVPSSSRRDLVCDDCVHLSEFGKNIYAQFAASLIAEFK
jgi:hypothetical protein